tara:strand:- start:2147 stop:2317 length:171 start_codon:yes stop_codon:yes gene_type:complete
MAMLALVAGQMSDKDLAIANWKRLKTFVLGSDPAYDSIERCITLISGDVSGDKAQG